MSPSSLIFVLEGRFGLSFGPSLLSRCVAPPVAPGSAPRGFGGRTWTGSSGLASAGAGGCASQRAVRVSENADVVTHAQARWMNQRKPDERTRGCFSALGPQLDSLMEILVGKARAFLTGRLGRGRQEAGLGERGTETGFLLRVPRQLCGPRGGPFRLRVPVLTGGRNACP